MAGLAAADSLRRAGAQVLVFEARDRVGGRVWSRELPNGAVIEMGAEFILPGSSVLLGMVRRFELGLWDKGMRYGDREPRGGIGVDPPSLLEATRVVASALPRASHRPAAEFLEGLPIDAGAREAITARLEVSSANTADAVSAADLKGLAEHSTARCPSIAGGNQRLAWALARELGSALHLRRPVDRVAWRSSGVRAWTGAVKVDADACVVAVPASVLGRIAFDPPLPAEVEEAVQDIVYGHAAKLFAPLSNAPETSAILSVPERYWTWTATGAEGRVQQVVSCFAGSAPALARLKVSEGPATWLESLRRLRPDLAIDAAGAVLSTWDDDPWVGAAYSTSTPRGPDAATLAQPIGPFVFCGEHTAGPLSALMEGALRSGVRAAEQVLARGHGD